MSEQINLTEEQQSAWVREQYQKATKYLAEKGLVTENVAPKDSRYLVPVVAIWKHRGGTNGLDVERLPRPRHSSNGRAASRALRLDREPG